MSRHAAKLIPPSRLARMRRLRYKAAIRGSGIHLIERPMTDLMAYVPTAQQLVGLAAVLAVGLAFTGLGAAVVGGRRLIEADLVSGWAVVCLFFTLVGVAAPVPFTGLAVVTAVAAIAALYWTWRRDGRLLVPGGIRILVLAAPLLLIATGMMPSQWDEFSHWLVSERYLLDVDGFPRAGGPVNPASFPGYPYGVPLPVYLASRLSGFLVENGGALFNILLLLAAGSMFIRVVRKGSGHDQTVPTWSLAAFGILGVTLLNTTFVQKVILTAYADLPSAAALAFAAAAGWLMLEAAAAGDDDGARAHALQMGLAAAALVNAKQANLVLFAMLLAGVAIAALRDREVGLARLLGLAPRFAAPAVVIYGVWQWHVAGHLTSGGMQVMAITDWQVEIIPQILATMGTIALKKGAYFGLMVVISACAVRAVVRFGGPFDRLAIITATIFVGYNSFLFFTYFAVFGGVDGINAVSYWRYNLHLGLLGVVCTGYGGALLWRRFVNRVPNPMIARTVVAAVLVLPIVFAPKLRFDIRAPKIYVRAVGGDIAAMLPPGSRLAVIDPLDVGFYSKMMAYALQGVAVVVGRTTVHYKRTPEVIQRFLDTGSPTHVWVHTQVPAVGQVLGQDLASRHSHLLAKEGSKWTLLKSWPYPGYDKPQDIPD